MGQRDRQDIMRRQHLNDPVVLHARWQMEQFGIPEREYQAWRAQMHSAKRRSIPFEFSLLAWSSWWRRELAKIGPGAKRGRRLSQYMMCRKGDIGPYSEANVYCGTGRDNQQDVRPEVKLSRSERLSLRHATVGAPLKGRTGARHPRSKPVITPLGTFESGQQAAEAHGITRQAVSIFIATGRKGWGRPKPAAATPR